MTKEEIAELRSQITESDKHLLDKGCGIEFYRTNGKVWKYINPVVKILVEQI